ALYVSHAVATEIYTLSLHDALPISALIHADVVNRHLLREDCGRVGVAGPVAADRFVEKQEERVVEDPLRARGQVCGRARLVELRSEEHTSELQSQSNLVCRLLLEKK